MKKLKDLLKESSVWDRKFGEKLPTLADVQKAYNDKHQLKEGPGADYNKEYQKVKHTYAQFWDAVQDFEDLLNAKGLKKHSKELNRNWKHAEKFYKFFFKMFSKLQ
jgi:hypothetical protein